MIGFPCLTGRQHYWCSTLPADGAAGASLASTGRKPLGGDIDLWLPGLMRQTGVAGKALWLCHEPPFAGNLSRVDLANPAWKLAVERFCPKVTVSGHDHKTPIETGTGQEDWYPRYCVIEFEFAERDCSGLPSKVTATIYPDNQTIALHLH